ncbi:MAG: hypothetical protein FWD37_04555, partial [Methanomassiliicoccaceae archaeon]|nr:hypothetical protein [Methanomassiliicoccaceae archaeon]
MSNKIKMNGGEKGKKYISGLRTLTMLSVVFLLSAAIVLVLSYDDPVSDDDTLGASYMITDAAGLAQLATEVNAGDSKIGMVYVLGNNIDLSSYASWTPIGINADRSFKGTFDGNGYTITGLKIERSASTGDNYIGLFGYVFTGGVVQNLTLEGVNITGYTYVGGITGYLNNASIVNCHVTGTVNGHDRVGGIAGNINVSSTGIKDCSFIGDVIGTAAASDNIGGIVGYMASSSVTGSFAEGTVKGRDSVGGIAGHLSSSASPSKVENCYYVGDVSGRNYVGGIMGDINMPNNNPNNSVNNCYAAGTVKGTNYVGGIAGYLYNGNVSNCAALNKSITATTGSTSYGRVLGNINAGVVSGNIAFSGMLAYSGVLTTDFNEAFNTPGDTGGIDINAAEIASDGALGNRFTSPVWTVEDGKLPDFSTPKEITVGGKFGYLLPISINDGMFNPITGTFVYNGSEHTPPVTANNIRPKVTFTVDYSSNISAGTATITITGTGNYKGTVTLNFTVLQKTITSDMFNPINGTFVYDGSKHTPGVTISGTEPGVTFSVTHPGINIDAGIASTTVTGTGNYGGTVILNFIIDRQPVDKPTINTGLIYALGTTHTGVNYDGDLDGDAYDIAGVVAEEESGNYSATFTLKDNYIWADGTDDDLILNWTIGNATGTAQVKMDDFIYGELASTPSVEDKTGDWTNAVFEYCLDNGENAPDNSWKSVAPMNAGKYWVRAILTESATGNFADLTVSKQYEIKKADGTKNPAYVVPTLDHTPYLPGKNLDNNTQTNLNSHPGWEWENKFIPLGNARTETEAFLADYTSSDPNYENVLGVKITVVIEKARISGLIPIANYGSLIYNGNEQLGVAYFWDMPGFYRRVVTSHNYFQTAQGNYETVYELIEPWNYMWPDGTSVDRVVRWTIGASIGHAEMEAGEVFVYDGMPKSPKVNVETLDGDWTNTVYEYWVDSNWVMTVPISVGTYSVRAILTESPGGNFTAFRTASVSFTIAP